MKYKLTKKNISTKRKKSNKKHKKNSKKQDKKLRKSNKKLKNITFNFNNNNNKKWVIYTSEGCPYCHKAREFLNKKKIEYDNISIDNKNGMTKLQDTLKILKKEDYNYIPVIITPSGEFLGGYSELTNFFKNK